MLYWPNFFSASEHQRLLQVSKPLMKKLRPEKNTLAKGRTGAILPADSSVTGMLLSEDVCVRVGRKVGADLLPGSYPVELRAYPVGSYMDWHADEVMYREPQFEMIYTLINTSDSETQWKDGDGSVISQWAEPNSLIVVQAGGPLHQVTRITRGQRFILKGVLTPTLETNEVFHQNLERDAF